MGSHNQCAHMTRYSSLVLLLLLCVAPDAMSQVPSVREGDVIFQILQTGQGPAIQQATKSRYTHVGIILLRDGSPCVFEAVEPVRFTALDKWIARGTGGHCVIKRLKDADSVLDVQALKKIHALVPNFEGKHYDLTFGWGDSTIYCSELVWKIYDRALGIRLGQLRTLKDFDLSSPVVREKMKQRYGDHVPLDETVISPADIFNAGRLTTIQTIN
jgi:hypothetical protein